MSLCWEEGWPWFFDPSTGTYLENWRQLAVSARAEASARAETAETELRRLRERLGET